MKLRIKHPDRRPPPFFFVIDGAGRLAAVVDPLGPDSPFDRKQLAEMADGVDRAEADRFEAFLADRYRETLDPPVRVTGALRGPLFFVSDREDRLVTIVSPFAEDGPLTVRQAGTMSTRPELILQFAHHLRDRYAADLPGPPKVRAYIPVSLDGREPALLIDPKADLAAKRDRLWPPADWILPLREPRPELQRVDVTPYLNVSPADEGTDEL